jgi:hypothetical protein
MATLNGWQRLWALVSGVWAVFWVALAILFRTSGLVYLSLAVVPPVLLYAVGLGVAWVRRGFRG